MRLYCGVIGGVDERCWLELCKSMWRKINIRWEQPFPLGIGGADVCHEREGLWLWIRWLHDIFRKGIAACIALAPSRSDDELLISGRSVAEAHSL